jgi:small subunit ribosomal protein S11
MFPDENTKNQIFNGIKFCELPVCHIKSTKNNTIIHLSDYNGKSIWRRSCGQEGFKNTRKGTNIAAQTTAISLANVRIII